MNETGTLTFSAAKPMAKQDESASRECSEGEIDEPPTVRVLLLILPPLSNFAAAAHLHEYACARLISILLYSLCLCLCVCL